MTILVNSLLRAVAETTFDAVGGASPWTLDATDMLETTPMAPVPPRVANGPRDGQVGDDDIGTATGLHVTVERGLQGGFEEGDHVGDEEASVDSA